MSAKRRIAEQAPIVASSHLISEGGWKLSELEFGLIIANNAFSRWVVRCAAAAGVKDLSALDVLVLHNINHRAREKTLADICFMLNVEDAHVVKYAVKKLMNAGLAAATRRGKETQYATTARGRAACQKYRDVREQCLIGPLQSLRGAASVDLRACATLLRALSGVYDQAARTASSF